MVSRPGEMPALESGTPEGLMGGMSLPIGMTRRALSYDDALEAPMSPPPSDINVNVLWRRPIIPDRKFQHLTEEDEAGSSLTPAASRAVATKPPVPVVKAKASSIIMSSLMTKQSHESIQRFEKQAGLTDTGYTPHKGLTAEETHYHRMAESLHNLKIQSGESRNDKQTSSTQSTPSSTPQTSPKQKRRAWFSQGSATSLTSAELGAAHVAVETASSEGAGAVERWSAFGPQPVVQKSTTDPVMDSATAGGFALQAYKGAQKPTPMELMKAQATRMSEEPMNLRAPKMEIPVTEGKRQQPRQHKLKPRDMNVLTPSGF